eukprot:TRINITY_DN11938_c0_g1_i1.p1 TRINITY_DN11938_c0_g1~~TRINITY_DN11938_c0_g1_i1.p1  ORF type:complete len:422 (+),score=57.54 TRINITY_DN11938_c0_g1_i1:30-1295(+)
MPVKGVILIFVLVGVVHALRRVTTSITPGSPSKFTYLGDSTPFLPRGGNYIRLNSTQGDPPTLPVYHSTFSPLFYNPARIRATLTQLSSQGYNLLRVFIDSGTPGRFDGLNGDTAAPFSAQYLANLVDFLSQAGSLRIYTMITFERLPENAYFAALKGALPAWVQPAANNADILLPGYHAAWAALGALFAGELRARLGDTACVFAYSIQNEANVVDDALPFSSRALVVTTADGRSYSMGDPAARQQCVDANAVHWVDGFAAGVRAEDPDAMVTVGVFTFAAVGKAGPNGILPEGPDPRHPFRVSSLSLYSTLSYLDVHIYPTSPSWSFEEDLASSEWSLVRFDLKPVLMGEFGAFKKVYPSIGEAASKMVRLQEESCGKMFSGWCYWTIDTWEQPFIWNMADANATLQTLLSPTNRPNPCL